MHEREVLVDRQVSLPPFAAGDRVRFNSAAGREFAGRMGTVRMVEWWSDRWGLGVDVDGGGTGEFCCLAAWVDHEREALVDHQVSLLSPLPGWLEQGVHAAGTCGVVLEALGIEPDGVTRYLVELRIPDPTLEGDARYDVVDIRADEFELHR